MYLMKALTVNKITKPYFTHEEIARVLGISTRSSRVSASRYVKHGLLVRIKRNLYVLREKWKTMDREAKFAIANLIQVPSYVSLMTALDYYEITTQIQQDFIESIAEKRTQEVTADITVFNFTRIQKNLYGGFIKKNNFFIATPEKAFLDALYLQSLGRYNLDIDTLDLSRLDRNTIRNLIARYPRRTQRLYQNECFRETRNF